MLLRAPLQGPGPQSSPGGCVVFTCLNSISGRCSSVSAYRLLPPDQNDPHPQAAPSSADRPAGGLLATLT